MVFEQFLHKRTVRSHLPFLFILSFFYVFIAYGVQQVFFPDQGLATVLLATILLVPSLHHLIIVEETIERSGSKQFIAKHKTVIRSYLGAFLGLLGGFLVLGMIDPTTLAYQQYQLQLDHLKPELITTFIQSYSPSPEAALALFTHNLQYLLVGLLVSLAYGAGSIFLVAYNASFFAAFILQLQMRFSIAPQLGLVSLSHLLPESAGFILTAIAGATLSRAIIKEKWGSQPFRNVLQNCVLLVFIGILLILAAAFIETYVTATAFQAMLR